jgi:hypothetical protein
MLRLTEAWQHAVRLRQRPAVRHGSEQHEHAAGGSSHHFEIKLHLHSMILSMSYHPYHTTPCAHFWACGKPVKPVI